MLCFGELSGQHKGPCSLKTANKDKTASDPAWTQVSHCPPETGVSGATGSRKTYCCSLFGRYFKVVYGNFYPRSYRHDHRNHTHMGRRRGRGGGGERDKLLSL